MQRARPADDEEAVVALFDDFDGGFAAFKDGWEGVGRGGEFGGEELRGN